MYQYGLLKDRAEIGEVTGLRVEQELKEPGARALFVRTDEMLAAEHPDSNLYVALLENSQAFSQTISSQVSK